MWCSVFLWNALAFQQVKEGGVNSRRNTAYCKLSTCSYFFVASQFLLKMAQVMKIKYIQSKFRNDNHFVCIRNIAVHFNIDL